VDVVDWMDRVDAVGWLDLAKAIRAFMTCDPRQAGIWNEGAAPPVHQINRQLSFLSTWRVFLHFPIF